MDTYHNEMIARVFSRVRADQPQNEKILLWLIGQELENASAYLQLSKRMRGAQAELVRQLYRQSLSDADSLKGIYALLTGSYPRIAMSAPPGGTTTALLRRCYGRKMQCCSRYESNASDGEYGKIYARLAKQAGAHCHTLLQLLGSLN